MQTIVTAGTEALAKLDELRAAWKPGMAYPFLIGTREDLNGLLEFGHFGAADARDILAEAESFDVAAWLRDKGPKRRPKAWPKKPLPGLTTLSLLFDTLTGEIKPEVYIGLLEVQAPHELFAHLRYGGWNDCPDPHVHVALHRYWAARFEATPVAVSNDIVECFVLAPPTSREGALELACEQFTYCYDIVEQGVGSIGKLASSLLESRFWYFWWD